MSYDLAVWQGERPDDDAAADRTFSDLYERYVGSGATVAPTEEIRAYVRDLVDRYPDTDEDAPWATGPLIGEACGPLLYFPMVWSRCEEVSAWAAQLAARHGLVCWDPQLERLRP